MRPARSWNGGVPMGSGLLRVNGQLKTVVWTHGPVREALSVFCLL